MEERSQALVDDEHYASGTVHEKRNALLDRWEMFLQTAATRKEVSRARPS